MTRHSALLLFLTLISFPFNHRAGALVHDKSQVSIPTPSLVRVLVEQEVPAFLLDNDYEIQRTVQEKASFEGFVLDSKVHVVFFMGEYQPSLQAGAVRFTVETRERKTYPAQLVGIDDRISLGIVRAELPGTSPLAWVSDPSFKHFNVAPAGEDTCSPALACLLASSSASWLPFTVLKVSGLTTKKQQCPLLGSLALDPKGNLLGFIVYMSPHRYNDKLAYTYVLPSKLIESSATTILGRGKSIPGGWLGIYLDENKQPTVDWVKPNSPAQRSGLQARDVIMGIDGHKVRGHLDLIHGIRFKGHNRKVLLDIRRGRANEKIVVSTGIRTPKYAATWAIDLAPEAVNYPSQKIQPRAERLVWNPLMDLGLIVHQVDEITAAAISFQSGGGFLVRSILRKSRAAEAGFKRGDILFRINKTELDSFHNLLESLEHAPEGRVRIYYLRGGTVKSSLLLVKP